MSLPPPQVNRKPLHTRSIRVNSFARDDGLWDIEAELIDVKAYDFMKAGTLRHPAGEPIHHMWLRITIDSAYNITDAVANYDAAPYGPHCTAITPDYADLVGMNLMRGFRQSVKVRFGRTAGCTHMTELCSVLPTAAVQTMAGERRLQPQDQQPFQLDGCHALRLDGQVAQEFYPRWYVSPRQKSGND